MAHIIIKNIGPIKEVEFDLNKINVFMGPQSSGKSTIAKIISFCLWVEKNVCLFKDTLEVSVDFKNKLGNYYHLLSYMGENSYILYQSEYVKIEYTGKVSGYVMPEKEVDKLTYKRSKIIYVPAERNLMALPYWITFKLSEDYLKSYASDWNFVRSIFNKEMPIEIKPLDVSYFYDEKERKDYISLTDGKPITLTDSSSGIQTSTSLYLMHKVYCQYRKKLSEMSSIEDEATLNKVYRDYLHYSTTRAYPSPIPESDQFDYKGKFCIVKPGTKEEAIRILDNYTEIQYIQSIIEEPELNLFPDTQQALIYELMADAVVSDNRMVMTTHSPYVLFALNNCVMGGLVGKNIPEDERKDFPSFESWIDPSLVSVYEIHDGTIKCIQDEDGIIEDNYLNQAYKKNSDEYISLLNYYEE